MGHRPYQEFFIPRMQLRTELDTGEFYRHKRGCDKEAGEKGPRIVRPFRRGRFGGNRGARAFGGGEAAYLHTG